MKAPMTREPADSVATAPAFGFPPPPDVLASAPPDVAYALPPPHHGHPLSRVVVTTGQVITAGAVLAQIDDADLHSAIAGTVDVAEHLITVRSPAGAAWRLEPEPSLTPPAGADAAAFAAFLAAAGAVGMGGSLFPAARKLRASAPVATLIVNGTECEPGLAIDRALLLHHDEWIRHGTDALARACGATRIVLAVQAAPRELAALRERYPYELAVMPRGYPAGAERLIVQLVTGRPLPAGRFPFQAGCLVQNVATLRGIGRALRDRVPFVERPLSLLAPAQKLIRNLIVPTGLSYAALLAATGCGFDPNHQVLVAGGLMMGRHVSLEDRVTLGTTGLFVLPARVVQARERACIRCGACHEACPLGLHPIAMVQRAANRGPRTRTEKAHIQACFLCGACAAACPAGIALAQRLREARQHV